MYSKTLEKVVDGEVLGFNRQAIVLPCYEDKVCMRKRFKTLMHMPKD